MSVKAVPAIGIPILESMDQRADNSKTSLPANATFDSHQIEPRLGTCSSRNQQPEIIDSGGTLREMSKKFDDGITEAAVVYNNSTQQLQKLDEQ